MGTGNVRSGSGNLKIASDIGLGVTGWIRYHATWQNNYNQSNYDINLELIYSAGFQLRYCQIDGKNGSYSVTTKSFISNGIDIKFGIDSSGNYGYYKVGADTVTPFKTGGYNFYSKGVTMSQGTWSGVVLKDSDWVTLTSSSYPTSSFTYTHNLNLDLSKVVAFGMSITDTTYGLRNANANAYRYFPIMYFFGQKEVNDYAYMSEFIYITDTSIPYLYTRFYNDTSSWNSSSSPAYSITTVELYKNTISLSFKRDTGNVPFAIKTTTPQFSIFIVYES